MTIPPPPPGQGPVDPRGAFSPPPGMYPPPMMMPPPFYPPPPRGGFARAIFTTLATTIFGLSIAANIYLLFYSGVLSGVDASRQTTLVNGDSKQTVAVINVTGLITDSTFNRFEKLLRNVEEDSNVKALVLRVDTPGGTVSASDEIYQRLMQFKENRKVPIVVSMGGYATSGGYYISCAADKIVAERTTITGNIGVLLENLNFSGLIEKWGIADNTLHSTGSDYKEAGSPFKPQSEKEQVYLQALIDDAYATFKSVVTKGRGNNLKATMDVIANGKAYTSSEALNLGLVDQSGYLDDACNLAASMAGLNNKQVVRFEPIPSLFDAFGADSKVQIPKAGVVNNGVNVNIDGRMLDDLTTPRLMYLWRGE